SVSLCLACSSSLPPRKVDINVYHTPCCSRPICPNCVSTNPRLTRYNPCLRCLAGVDAVNSKPSSSAGDYGPTANIDGSIRDEDIFVLEDDDQSDLEVIQENDSAIPIQTGPSSSTPETSPCNVDDEGGSTRSPSQAEKSTSGIPFKYFIRPQDTLVGISLKLGIDGRLLCRLNNLPISTLRTNPHLLHTRSFLVLPPSASQPPPLSAAEQAADDERKARLSRERAETRFQTTTKEADRDVARAYVALADLPEASSGDLKEYEKEQSLRKRRVRVSEDGEGETSVEGRAMDQYYDDDEWEAQERAEGRKAGVSPFP
ncbi:hypothetical protein BD413DRAFT_452104, partial [Trametes elegans]